MKQRSAFLFITLLVLTFSLAGCGSSVVQKSALISPNGVSLDQLLPANSMMVIKYGTDNKNIDASLKDLVSVFPKKGIDTAVQAFIDEFDKSAAQQAGITFENDLAPALGDLRMMMSISTANTDISTDADPNMIIAVALQDVTKMKTIIEKILAADGEKQDYLGNTIYLQKATSIHAVIVNDVLVISNQLDQIKRVLDNVAAKKTDGTLYASAKYQKALNRISDNLAFFYEDVEGFSSLLSTAQTQMNQTQQQNLKNLVAGIKTEIISINPEKDGFRLKGYMDSVKGSGFDLSTVSKPAYLYKKIASSSPLLYAEGYNLQKIIEMEAEILKATPDLDIEQITNILLAGFTYIETNFETDVKPFLDKGYALVISDTGYMIPGFGIYLDASSKPEGAKKLVNGLGKLVTAQTAAINADPFLVKNDKSTATGFNGYTFSIDTSAIKEDTKKLLPSSVFTLNYGVTADNLFTINYGSPLESSDVPVIAENPGLKEALKLVNYDENDFGMAYLNLEAISKYLERIMMDTPETAVQYEEIKAYLAPLKSIVSVSSKIGDEFSFDGFIQIAR